MASPQSSVIRSILAVAVLTTVAAGQFTTLTISPVRVGSPYTVSVTHFCGGTPLWIAVDSSPGPTTLNGVGTVSLGITPNMYYMAENLVFDATGTRNLAFVCNDISSLTGAIVYAQAVGLDPLGRVSLSNPVVVAIQPKIRSDGRVEHLSLADDQVIQHTFTAMSFPFYGAEYLGVSIDSNGYLGFGTVSASDPLETTTHFLDEFPRIAILWDDIDPSAAGAYVWIQESTSHMTVVFSRVPQYGYSDSNTLACTLYADGTIAFFYDAIGTQDGIVGISPGGSLSSAPSRNLSAATFYKGGANEAIYEQFTAQSPFNLAHTSLAFVPDQGTTYTLIR